MLYLLLIERRKKQKGEMANGLFCPVGCAAAGFS
jgi:hypothetical protein